MNIKTYIYIGGALFVYWKYTKVKKQIVKTAKEVGKRINPANDNNYINSSLGGIGNKIGSAIYDWTHKKND